MQCLGSIRKWVTSGGEVFNFHAVVSRGGAGLTVLLHGGYDAGQRWHHDCLVIHERLSSCQVGYQGLSQRVGWTFAWSGHAGRLNDTKNDSCDPVCRCVEGCCSRQWTMADWPCGVDWSGLRRIVEIRSASFAREQGPVQAEVAACSWISPMCGTVEMGWLTDE